MKRSLISFIVLALAISVSAQAPLSFKYQAYLRNADGSIRGSEFVTLQLKIVQGTINGAEVYTEVHNTSTNNHGLVSVDLGDGSTSYNIAAVQWGSGPYFLNISVNGVNLGTTELLSVPFALYANESRDSFSGAYTDLTGAPNLARVATTGNYSDLINTPHLATVATTGSYASLLNIPLTFVPDVHTHLETDISDLAHYSDDSISGLEPVFLHWDRDTADDFSGSYLELTDVPPFSDHYTDDSIDGMETAFMGWDKDTLDDFSGSYLDLTDVPPSTAHYTDDSIDGTEAAFVGWDMDVSDDFVGDMGGSAITNLLDPTNPQDAATMAYVDASSGSFSGSYNDLSDVPALAPAVHTHAETDITDLTHYTDSDIDGTETAFDNWDKDVTDDFDGDYGSLTNHPLQIGEFGGDMQTADITNLTMPVAPGDPADAVNRAYVDALELRVAALEAALIALEARVTLHETNYPNP